MVEAFITYASSPRLYIWKKEARKPEPASKGKKVESVGVYVPPLSESNLKDLAWSLDIKEQSTSKPHVIGQEKGKAPLLKDL